MEAAGRSAGLAVDTASCTDLTAVEKKKQDDREHDVLDGN